MVHATRRFFLLGSVAIAATGAAAPAFAISESKASALVDSLVGAINAVIASGRSENVMIGEFEKIFARYADVPTIARSALGPAARSASAAEMRAFTAAFRGYMARKYGKRFRSFAGGKITVKGATNRGKYYEVKSVANLRGSAPFDIAFRVSDRSGNDLFFDLLIEGISLLSTERAEIGAMLDRAGGKIGGLTAALKKVG